VRERGQSSNRVEVSSSSNVFKVSKNCPPGKKLIAGSCKWDLLGFESRDSWCFADDFTVGHEGCRNCLVSFGSTSKRVDGDNKNVITSIVYRNANGEKVSATLDESSCSILDARDITETEQTQCGFFCFFQKLDSIYENDTRFTCKYVPPSAFGLPLGGNLFAGLDVSDKVEKITAEIVCG